jgi:hypothetical protein
MSVIAPTTSKDQTGGGKMSSKITEMSKEKLAAFESYRAHDAFHPPSARVVSFWAFLGVVIFLLILLLNKVDQLCISGVRFVPHIVVFYILLCIFRLWIQCEWALWTAWRRGLKFEERLLLAILLS